MDIQQAINLLSGENHKYFLEQINHFEIDVTTPLKQYLDSIDNDVLAWFKLAPENIKAESTYYKFKSPVQNLLQHKDVVQQNGHIYCNTLYNKIKSVFSKHKQDIVKDEKKINIDENNEHKTNTYASSDTSTEDNSSIPDPVYEDPQQRKETVDDCTKKVKLLDSQLQEALTEIRILKTSIHHITQEKDNYLKLLMK